MTCRVREKGHKTFETPNFNLVRMSAQKASSLSFLLNELKATKGLLIAGFAQTRVEVSLGFIFDTTAVKARLHHNCFLSPFKMVFRSLKLIIKPVESHKSFTVSLLSQYGSQSSCVSSTFNRCLILNFQ